MVFYSHETLYKIFKKAKHFLVIFLYSFMLINIQIKELWCYQSKLKCKKKKKCIEKSC